MTTTLLCPSCGKPLAPNAPLGLCPACLMQGAFASRADSSLHGPSTAKSQRFVPPTPEELAAFFPALEILEFIGQGGMGAVYKARQKELDRIVALKILPPGIGDTPGFPERFTLEAKALAKLNHPNIVTLFEFGRANGLFFFLMEFVDGMTLRQLLKAARVSPREALAIVPQICDALQFAHDQGIVHRDIKPENVLLDRRGRVKVADFGLAKLVQASNDVTDLGLSAQASPALTESGKVVGTPNYMAPEQFLNPSHVDHRADIYALGVVFYQMLTGELPGQPMEVPWRKVQLDVRLNEVVLRALEKEPERRYQQASEVKTAVETIASASAAEEAQTREPAREFIAPPALARPAAALWAIGLLGLILSLLIQLRGFSSDALDFSLGAFGYWRIPMPPVLIAAVAALMPLSPVLNLLVLLAGARMRRLQDYPLAIAGTALSVVALPLFPLGCVIGLWTLTVLLQRDVRSDFRKAALARAAGGASVPRFSTLAVIAATFAVLPVLRDSAIAAVLALGAAPSVITNSFGGLLMSSLVVSMSGWLPLATLLLGWIALEDIRRARGSLKGSGLAIFALGCLPVAWAMQPLYGGRWPVENTLQDNALLGLAGQILTLTLCGGVGLWVHWQEMRRFGPGGQTAVNSWWFYSKPVASAIRLLACSFILLQLGSGFQFLLARTKSPPPGILESIQAHDHLALPTEDTSRFVATSPTGDVELLAVSDASSNRGPCWRPDGSPLCPLQHGTQPPASTQAKARWLVLSLRFPTFPDRTSILPFQLATDGRELEAVGGSTVKDPLGERGFIIFSAPAKIRQVQLYIAGPLGDWEDTDAGWPWTGKIPRHPERMVLRSGQQLAASLEHVSSANGTSMSFTLRSWPTNWIGRIVAVDQTGTVHAPDAVGTSLRDESAVRAQRWVHSDDFKGLPAFEIKEFRLQIRRTQWTEFRHISLDPTLRTSPQVLGPAK